MSSKIKSELVEFINIFESFLPKDDIKSIQELVDVGEYGVAFENFCTQLHEYDVEVEESIVERLASIGTEMKLNKTLWADLLSR